jgi:fatty-acyl-CoA synthase
VKIGSPQKDSTPSGFLRIEDCLDVDGDVVLPPGATLTSLIDRNVVNLGNEVAYRYLDFTRSEQGVAAELTWRQLGIRIRAIGAELQRIAARGERVAVLAPQGLDYITGFFAAVKSGLIAVPLFAPELPGHAERLDTALRDARPSVILTTSAAAERVRAFLDGLDLDAAPVLLDIDEIPDEAAGAFTDVHIDLADVSHLQYTSGATRPPAGVEVTHRAVGTNLIQMILSIDLLDRNTCGVSWLPLYHDMGLSMIGFPAVYGGHSTLMSPTAFVRRPQRWIAAMSDEGRVGRVVSAAPNFAYEWAAARGVPSADDDVDLGNVVLIIGSEPVSMAAIDTFTEAFTPHGLSPTAIKPSYGIAEATLFVATIAPDAVPTALSVDRDRLAEGGAVPVPADHPAAVTHVSCGQVARSLSCVIVDPATTTELPDGRVGEIWLHGDNVGRGYWNRPEETNATFGARLRGHDEPWLRSGDLGFFLDGALYVTGRIADLVTIAGRVHYPQDIERTAADVAPLVRRGYAAAFGADDGSGVVIVAERATGTARIDPAPAIAAIRDAVQREHGVAVADVKLVPAGALARTTSGKLARRACHAQYAAGDFG